MTEEPKVEINFTHDVDPERARRLAYLLFGGKSLPPPPRPPKPKPRPELKKANVLVDSDEAVLTYWVQEATEVGDKVRVHIDNWSGSFWTGGTVVGFDNVYQGSCKEAKQ